jgi:arylsulfatase A-like enzyme
MWVNEQARLSRLPELPADSPNIMVIMVDTLRADHLSTYGYERSTSPFIDQIAAQGVLFENAYSGSTYSYPAHASLFTGLPLHEHQAEWDNLRALFKLDAPVFPELLLNEGYRTGAFSANTFWVTRKDGFGRGFLHFEDYFTTPLDSVLRTGMGLAFEKLILSRVGEKNIPARRWGSDINQSALDWIDQSPDKPFFVFLNYLDVHDPYLPPAPYRNMFSTQDKPGGLLNWHIGREFLDLTPEQVQGEIDAYDGSIRYTDDQITSLLQELESRGLTDNLLLVILADHGEAFGEHGVYLHGNSLYREELHVPLIFYWPGHLPAGQRLSQPVSIDSLGSTLLEMIDSPAFTQFPGPSLVSLWQGDGDPLAHPMPLAEIYAKSWYDPRSLVKTNSLRSLLNDQWQYIEASNLPEELYNFTNDKLETENQVDNPAAAELLANFRTELKSRTSTQMKTTGSSGE